MTSDLSITHTVNDLIVERLRVGKTIRLEITTTSMLPLLRPGVQLVVQSVERTKVHAGDILVWLANRDWIAHRVIVCSAGHQVVTKGDHNLYADAFPVSGSSLGLVTRIENGARHLDLTDARVKFINKWIARVSNWQRLAFDARMHWIMRVRMRVCGWFIRLCGQACNLFYQS
jgi:signal peptidase I